MTVATSDKQFSHQLFVNKQRMANLYKNCADFVINPIEIDRQPYIMLMYLQTLVDEQRINEAIITSITQSLQYINERGKKIEYLKRMFNEKQFAINQIETSNLIDTVNEKVASGYVAMFLDGESDVILIDLIHIEERAIEEPGTEITIRGPKDSFNESLQTNLNLLRQRIRSNRLKFTQYTLGNVTKTDVIVAYIDEIVDQSLVEEVNKRLKEINVDNLSNSELVEELIEDNPYTPFPLVQNTERPDNAVGNLFEGRIVILVDHTPFVLIVPMTFWNGFEATGDTYERFNYVMFIRVLRLTLLLVAVFLPSIYVALTTYHPKLIPTSLLISIAAARETVPFPAIVEAFIMELVFEGLREAGLRLPKAIGQAISILGAIVIGQAAVEAGIVSTTMVIVVAATGISSFAIPKYSTEVAIRLIRFPMLILAGLFGLFGITIGIIVLVVHLVSLRSFNVPYFKPVAPQIPADLLNMLLKTPKWANSIRAFFRFERS